MIFLNYVMRQALRARHTQPTMKAMPPSGVMARANARQKWRAHASRKQNDAGAKGDGRNERVDAPRERTDQHQRERVIHVVARAGFVNGERVRVEVVAQCVCAESAGGDRQRGHRCAEEQRRHHRLQPRSFNLV